MLPSCFMGAGASAEKTDELLAEFRKADTDGNGDISLEELKAIHKREDGDTYDEAKVEAEFEKLDKNHDGRVQVSEYLESAGVKKKVAREIDQTEAVMRAVGDETLNAAHEEHERRAAGEVGGEQLDLTVEGTAAVPAVMDDEAMSKALAASNARTNRRMSAVGNEDAPVESRRNRRTSAVGTDAEAAAAAAAADGAAAPDAAAAAAE